MFFKCIMYIINLGHSIYNFQRVKKVLKSKSLVSMKPQLYQVPIFQKCSMSTRILYIKWNIKSFEWYIICV